jgi:hypothetical protein
VPTAHAVCFNGCSGPCQGFETGTAFLQTDCRSTAASRRHVFRQQSRSSLLPSLLFPSHASFVFNERDECRTEHVCSMNIKQAGVRSASFLKIHSYYVHRRNHCLHPAPSMVELFLSNMILSLHSLGEAMIYRVSAPYRRSVALLYIWS